jgi:5'(3')-deoxyribonucleotidase
MRSTAIRKGSQVSKILVDVDGPAADMVGDLFERMDGDLKKEDFPDWDIFDAMTKEQREQAYSILQDPSFWANLPLVDGSKKAIKHLKDFGHKIVWVTAPWSSCFGWDNARRYWIEKNFGDDSVITASDKEHTTGDVFIDDKPDNIDAMKKAHPNMKVFIFDTPHNKKYTGAPRFTWADVGKLT